MRPTAAPNVGSAGRNDRVLTWCPTHLQQAAPQLHPVDELGPRHLLLLRRHGCRLLCPHWGAHRRLQSVPCQVGLRTYHAWRRRGKWYMRSNCLCSVATAHGAPGRTQRAGLQCITACAPRSKRRKPTEKPCRLPYQKKTCEREPREKSNVQGIPVQHGLTVVRAPWPVRAQVSLHDSASRGPGPE